MATNQERHVLIGYEQMCVIFQQHFAELFGEGDVSAIIAALMRFCEKLIMATVIGEVT